MDGEFYTDMTRDTFRKRRHYSRVLMQQGRVQLDADWNEQTDILLHYMRRCAADLIGHHGGPGDEVGFAVSQYMVVAEPEKDRDRGKGRGKKPADKNPPQPVAYQFLIEDGRYYVDGILIENERDEVSMVSAPEQQGKKAAAKAAPVGMPYLFYLDVWEREVTYLEDDSIREAALGGIDTATRSEIVWRVRSRDVSAITEENLQLATYTKVVDNKTTYDIEGFGRAWTDELREWQNAERGLLKARTIETEISKDACTVPPAAQFRGEENQLYRVQIHEGGNAWSDAATGKAGQATSGATFVWSRENGSVVFPIVGSVTGGQSISVTVENLGRDDSNLGLEEDDWVEIVDIEDVLEGKPGPLLYVDKIDTATLLVTLKSYQGQTITMDKDSDPQRPLFLRRWDYKDIDPILKGVIQLADSGAAKVIENKWFTLENGIQILFHLDEDEAKDQQEAGDTPPRLYRTGDYWLIPARTASGKIEWPGKSPVYEALPPHGVKHHYAPLAYTVLQDGKVYQDPKTQIEQLFDLRRRFEGLATAITKIVP